MVQPNTLSPKPTDSDLIPRVLKPTVPNSSIDNATESIKTNSSSSPQVPRISKKIRRAPTRFKY